MPAHVKTFLINLRVRTRVPAHPVELYLGSVPLNSGLDLAQEFLVVSFLFLPSKLRAFVKLKQASFPNQGVQPAQ